MTFLQKITKQLFKKILIVAKEQIAKSSWHKTLSDNNWAYISEPKKCSAKEHNFPTYCSSFPRGISGSSMADLCQCGQITFEEHLKVQLKNRILQ